MNTATMPATQAATRPAAAQAARGGALAAAPGLSSQFLTFMLGEEQFAVGILGIKEIIEYGSLAVVPMMPACVRGVINLRGAVVPVLDLAERFGRSAAPITKRSCIVIVELGEGEGKNDGKQVLGMLVDAVHAVVDIAQADIEPPPAFGTRIRPDFIAGIGKVAGRFVSLLDLERVLSSEEIVDLARGALAARN